MKITEITVGARLTVNLGDYSNTQPSVQLVAVLTDDDDPQAVAAELERQATALCRQMADDELMKRWKDPIYYVGESFDVLRVMSSSASVYVVVPAGTEVPAPPQARVYRAQSGWPLENAVAVAHGRAAQHGGAEVLVCSGAAYLNDLRQALAAVFAQSKGVKTTQRPVQQDDEIPF